MKKNAKNLILIFVAYARKQQAIHSIPFLLLFFFFSQTQSSIAQVYPVQGSATLLPPYSLRLSDYATSTSERMITNVLLTDVTKAELQVRFRLIITSQNVKIETKPEYIGTPIALQGGVPLRLTNVELAEYFDVNHLNFSGLSKSEFMKTGLLPEGFYTFCWEVYEVHHTLKINNNICAPAWLILNDPPLVNLPRNGEKLKAQSPQNVMIQWTPRNTGSPNSAFTTEYEVKVVEVWPVGRNPNDAILSQPVIYEATTSNTTLIYGPDATPLEPGRTYALRVQAKAMTNAEQIDLFKNNGYSETITFVYGDACDAPANIKAQHEGATKFSLQWDEAPTQTGYTVRFREGGKENANWYTTISTINTTEISGLQPGTAYEYEVMSTCGSFESSFSSVATITTDAQKESSYSCGVMPPNFNLDPSQLLPVLKVGEVVNAGDFDVTITKVAGASGTFSGEGAIEVPFLNQVRARVTFHSITVNNDHRMVKGVMNVTGGGVEIIPADVLNTMDKLVQEADKVLSVADSLAKILNPEKPDPAIFIADTEMKIKDGISRVYKNPLTGEVIVEDKKGKSQTLPAGKDIVLIDDKGKGVLVNSQGGITNTTAEVAHAATRRELKLSLTFAKSTNTKKGLDLQKEEALKGNYQKLGDNYYVAWKAVATDGGDGVIAVNENKEIQDSEIRFEQDGTKIETAGNLELLVYSVATETRSSVVAKVVPKDTAKKEQILGKLNIVGYEHKPMKLHIVRVNKAQFTMDAKAIEAALNDIYGQAVVSWEVEVAKENLMVSGPHDPFDDGSSGLLSNYTDDMKMVINAQGYLIDDEYYLFVIDKPASGSKLGYMPRGKQAGFIFIDPHGTADDTPARNARIITTMAHELGHGAFTLKHTWSDYTSLSERSTDNLMDYNNGTQLWKLQWDRIHDPVTVLGLFESDESGASINNDDEITGYVISDAKAYIRMIARPNEVKVPNEILPQGKEVVVVSTTSADKFSIVKFPDKKEIYLTSTSNIKPIIKLIKPEKYLVKADVEAVVLPYSSDQAGEKLIKDSYVVANKSCGDYYQVKENTTSNSGWWIAKTSLKRVGDDIADNFDWMKTVTVESSPATKEVLDIIESNLKGINDKTDKSIYGLNSLKPYVRNGVVKGMYYTSNSDGEPQFSGDTEFVKEIKRLIFKELAKEGGYSSINTYDHEIFTWGKGFSVRGQLMKLIMAILNIDSKYERIFLNVGIKVVNGHFWVLADNGLWLKDDPLTNNYAAANYIKSNTKLLNFFTELGEKREYRQDIINAHRDVIMLNDGAGNFPEYILTEDKKAYSKKWSNASVTLLSHLSHWCGYSWAVGTDRYKDTEGDLPLIIYKYIYNTVRTARETRLGNPLETNIYRWNPSYDIMGLLQKIGDPEGIGLSTINETWDSNLIEIEQKKDKNGTTRILKANSEDFITNSECVLIAVDDKVVVITKNADAITYGKLE